MSSHGQIIYCYLHDNAVAELLAPAPDRVYSARDLIIRLAEPNEYRAVIIKSMSQIDAAIALLNTVRTRYPELVRILITGECSSKQRYHAAAVAHCCLPAQTKPTELRRALDRALRTEEIVHSLELKLFTKSIKRLPAVPKVVHELTRALDSETAGVKEISRIISREPAIAAKVMQLVNSAYFGARGTGSMTLEAAVTLIGERELRDLTVTAQLFNIATNNANWQAFDFERLQERSALVGNAAAAICKSMKMSSDCQAQARLAGLLCDVGMLVLASENPENYATLIATARNLNQRLYGIEKMEIGTTHAHVGALLLDTWMLAPEIVHAVLFHHNPAASNDSEFSILTAVHVADALIVHVPECFAHRKLSKDYVSAIGCADKLDEWTAIVNQCVTG